jgi:ketosteroid isomerase-like protein
MSEEKLELLRRAYESVNAVGRTDRESLDPEVIAPEVWDRVDPAFELHERPDLPDRKVYRGREQSKQFWRKTSDIFAEIRWEIREMIDMGPIVVVDSKIVATGRGSDVEVEVDEYDVWWFRDGMIVRLQAFVTMPEAMAAAEAGSEASSSLEPT